MPTNGGYRWLSVALGVSLILNLFLLGFVAGRHSQQMPIGAATSGSALFAARVRNLPAGERTRFGLAMLRHRTEIRATGYALRDSGRAVLAVIAAPAYDRARVERALADLRARRVKFQEATHSAVLDGLDEISPKSRASLGAPISRP